ncbi:CsgG/HfaB family protein [Phenylobacterium sp.]|uniref:CsgG/HfaB family protein n=1 Tax=Phenylobacterium sp. TaxID=1871053 RepID=UPI0035AF9E79
MRSLFVIPAICVALAGCASTAATGLNPAPATLEATTATQRDLEDLPAPARKVVVAVYGFNDLTGQFKPTDTGQTLSRAVSQGGGSILVKALQDAGERSWFTVVEREHLDNLLKERQIINEMRARYLGERSASSDALPAMLFAGVILEGGIVGFDSNTMTGGAGAAFLGVGGDVKYRQDTVTVNLRAVSVRSGEVLASVTTSKTIASYALQGSAFRYVAYQELLQAESGITYNEPDQIALQQAIEKAVYALVMEGVELKLWDFADPIGGLIQLDRYRKERAGVLTAEQVEKLNKKDRRERPQGQPQSSRSASKSLASTRSGAPQGAAAYGAEQARDTTLRGQPANSATPNAQSGRTRG